MPIFFIALFFLALIIFAIMKWRKYNENFQPREKILKDLDVAEKNAELDEEIRRRNEALRNRQKKH